MLSYKTSMKSRFQATSRFERIRSPVPTPRDWRFGTGLAICRLEAYSKSHIFTTYNSIDKLISDKSPVPTLIYDKKN